MVARADIDSLSERVRSLAARTFIREAVACYRAGAYRQCIVATWIALVYDFIDKFRDLALSGDASAVALVQEFDRIQRDRDTAAALKFEREVLGVAKDRYELISPQELVDLQRLFEDRNRFSHPNLNQDLDALSAPAELARLHLVNAVEHVLQRPPVQGKVALGEIRDVVDSPYFPKDTDDAVTTLKATPLQRAKKPVIRDFFLGCVGSLFLEPIEADAFDRRFAASQACSRMHPEIVADLVEERLSSLFDKVSDDRLPYLLVLIARVPEYERRLSEALRVRLRNYTPNIPDKLLGVINFAAELPFLRAEVLQRLDDVTPGRLREFMQTSTRAPSQVVMQHAITMYERAQNWDSANAIATAISERMVDKLAMGDALRILHAGTNDEVKYSFNYPPLVKKLVEAGLLSNVEVQKAVNDLEIEVLAGLNDVEQDPLPAA